MKKVYLNIVLLSFITILATNCSKEGEMPNESLSEREQAIKEYNDNYLGSNIMDPGWTGNISTCDAGSVPQTTHDKVIKRINYFRNLVGLNSTTLDESQFQKYQETALMMKANGQLSHTPPDTWICWTQVGDDGAFDSNIDGNHSSEAITNFIEDFGSNNTNVPHRRWILHSKKTQFSYGTTSSTMALAVKGVANGNSEIPPFIAYPPNGYIPEQLVFPRWSFSIPNSSIIPINNFSTASVKMTGPDGEVDLNIISTPASNIADNTIVWEPQGILSSVSQDQVYTVVISGVENASESSYTYEVVIINP